MTVPAELAGQTIAAAIKRLGGERSWSEVKRLISQRHVRVNTTLCLDEARRIKPGDLIKIAGQSAAPISRADAVTIVHRDHDVVVIDKPAGVQTVRRFEERHFSDEKKRLQPTLDELVSRRLTALNPRPAGPHARGPLQAARVRVVHRLDRDTSGLMLFALSPVAEAALIKQFAAHEVKRVYTAVVHGRVEGRHTITTHLTRDRGDGLRGSVPDGSTEAELQHAVTHLRTLEHIGDRCTVLDCRLETGRTHQIRIHLAEMGHRLCGEALYTRAGVNGVVLEDSSGAPRQALHSRELQFVHPVTGAVLRFESPLPADLARWLMTVRSAQ